MLFFCYSCRACETDRLDCVFLFPQHHSAKAYKRHSSVIPSTHLLEEVKEVKAMSDETDFAPGQY